MEDGQRLVFRHIHLVQDAEAAHPRALAHRAFPEADLAPLQRIGADEGRRIHVDVHGNVPHRAAEQGGQILRQHVFAGGLGACEKQILSAQHRRRGGFPDVFSVVYKSGAWNPAAHFLRHAVGIPEGANLCKQLPVYALSLQLLPNIHDKSLLAAFFLYFSMLRGICKENLSLSACVRQRFPV